MNQENQNQCYICENEASLKFKEAGTELSRNYCFYCFQKYIDQDSNTHFQYLHLSQSCHQKPENLMLQLHNCEEMSCNHQQLKEGDLLPKTSFLKENKIIEDLQESIDLNKKDNYTKLEQNFDPQNFYEQKLLKLQSKLDSLTSNFQVCNIQRRCKNQQEKQKSSPQVVNLGLNNLTENKKIEQSKTKQKFLKFWKSTLIIIILTIFLTVFLQYKKIDIFQGYQVSNYRPKTYITRDLKFNEKTTLDLFNITKEGSKVQKISDSGDWYFALMTPHIYNTDRKDRIFQIKITKKYFGQGVYVGLCHFNTIVFKKGFRSTWELGSGAYLIGDSGQTYNSFFQSENKKKTKFYMQSGDILYMAIDLQESSFFLQNRNKQITSPRVSFLPNETDPLFLCVCLGNKQSSFQFLKQIISAEILERIDAI